MSIIRLFHYVTTKKYEDILAKQALIPSAPFNPRITDEEWDSYIHYFPFRVARFYTCCFFEPKPKSWEDYGLFELLMEEFAGGDYLLILNVLMGDEGDFPILVRDHSFHSPRSYGKSPQEWRKREIRDSRPDLRNAWYQSTVSLKDYDDIFICPEVLIPFKISLDKIKATGGQNG